MNRPRGADHARGGGTRQRLLDAALELIGEGRSFNGLGLREIARRAGVVPTAFYRHFHDLDELGMALVDEGGLTLRQLLREARRQGLPDADMIRRSVEIYKRYVLEHPLQFGFVAGERFGGSREMRAAIRREVGHFSNELAQDLEDLRLLPGASRQALRMIADLVVGTMLNAASEILDLPRDRDDIEVALTERFVNELRLIFLGAAQWHDDPQPTAGRATSAQQRG